MRPVPLSLVLAAAAAALLAAAPGGASPALPTTQSQSCFNTLPMGLLPPVAGFTTGCSRRFTLKLGASIGPDGNYILLGYPGCSVGTCSGQTGVPALQCQAANGFACCLNDGLVVSTIQGLNVAAFQTGINQRIASDTDTRSGICFSEYAGNGRRVVNAPIITLQSGNTEALLHSFVTLFVVSPPTGSLQSATVTVEMLNLDATPARGETWGRIKLLYR